MNMLAKLLAGTAAGLAGPKPEPDTGRHPESGAFRSLLERMGLSAGDGADGAPATAKTLTDQKKSEPSSERRADHAPTAGSKRMVPFPTSLGHVGDNEPGRNGEADQSDAALATVVPPPAAGTVSELHPAFGGDAARGDRAEVHRSRTVPSRPTAIAQPATPSQATAPPDVKASISGATSSHLPPSALAPEHAATQVSRRSRTPGQTMSPSATPDPRTIVAAVTREETHLPPARPQWTPSLGELTRADHADREQDDGDGHRAATAADRRGEARDSVRVAQRDTVAPPTRPPAAQQHLANTAAAVGAAPESGSGAGLPATVLQTLATAMGDAIGPEPAKGPTPLAPLVEPPVPGPVRDVAVKLDIPDHGVLNVRMSLQGNALTVRLNAEREETAHRLRHDRDALSHLLRQAGYDANIVAIEGKRPAAALTQHAPPQTASAPGGHQTGSGGASSGSEQRDAHAFDQQPQRPGDFQPFGKDQAFDETNQPRSRDPRGLYV